MWRALSLLTSERVVGVAAAREIERLSSELAVVDRKSTGCACPPPTRIAVPGTKKSRVNVTAVRKGEKSRKVDFKSTAT